MSENIDPRLGLVFTSDGGVVQVVITRKKRPESVCPLKTDMQAWAHLDGGDLKQFIHLFRSPLGNDWVTRGYFDRIIEEAVRTRRYAFRHAHGHRLIASPYTGQIGWFRGVNSRRRSPYVFNEGQWTSTVLKRMEDLVC